MDFKSDIRFKGIEPEDGKVAMTLLECSTDNINDVGDHIAKYEVAPNPFDGT